MINNSRPLRTLHHNEFPPSASRAPRSSSRSWCLGRQPRRGGRGQSQAGCAPPSDGTKGPLRFWRRRLFPAVQVCVCVCVCVKGLIHIQRSAKSMQILLSRTSSSKHFPPKLQVLQGPLQGWSPADVQGWPWQGAWGSRYYWMMLGYFKFVRNTLI